MKFVDEVRISVRSGDGGNGAVAFRREKFIAKGGPSGGDGGHGGSVVFIANSQLTTLLDYRYQQHHHARNGQNGMGSDCNGRGSDDLVLKVPVGTLIRDTESGELLADLSEAGEQFVAAQGGRGGLGNMNFATSTRQAPRFAQDGTPGELREVTLELKLLADVGLLGFPNAGKSTFISRVSRARPKIADYPFTTLVPNLGLVSYKDSLSFVLADIPGLIEGASEGAGLGHQFLRHVERCRVLIHLVDFGAQGEGRSPLEDWNIINRELARYSPELSRKPQIVAANKMDLPYAREQLEAFEAALAEEGIPVFPVSSATGEGLSVVLDAAASILFSGATEIRAPRVKGKARPKNRLGTEPVTVKPKKAAAEEDDSARLNPVLVKKARAGELDLDDLDERTLEALTRPDAEDATVVEDATLVGEPSFQTPAKARKPVAKKPAVKKPAAKKPAAKKPVAKKSAAKKAVAKKPAAKKPPVAKKPAAKKALAKKPAAKKAVAKKPAAKKAVAKKGRR